MVELIIKKSRFISYASYITDEIEAKSIIESITKEHKRCRHVVFAYRVRDIEKFDDAGEPSGTAGIPTLSAIKRRELDNVIVVTVRYFGGILLGKGGLIRAYGKCAGTELDRLVRAK